MKKKFINQMKQMLNDQKEEILNKSSQYKEDIDLGSDDADLIQSTILANTIKSLAAHDKTKLHKIEYALKRIGEGTFGYCEECGEEIAEKRLLINPSFNTCIVCAEKIEILAKRNGR